MHNINPAPSQNNYNQPLVSNNDPNLQTPITPAQNPVISEAIKITKTSSSGNASNKLWIIFLVLVAMIIGFWLGYFTNDYLYQSAQEKSQELLSAIDEQIARDSVQAPDLIEVEKSYINFRGEWNYIGDALNFTSEQQCVADEIVTLVAIDDDFLTIEIKHPVLQEDSGEYVIELGDYQVRDQECLVAESSCLGTGIDRCFSLENIDGVWHLDYDLIESTTLDQAEEVESVVPVETIESVEAEI